MDERLKYLSKFIVWTFVLTNAICKGATVSKVTPKYGSLAGESRLTIQGTGFSADQFSKNDDPNVGNKVYLVSESGSEYKCTVHKDGCTEKQIMFYTPRGLNEEDHYVKVVVDGQVVDDSDLCYDNPKGWQCTFKPQTSNTPTIETFTPQSGMPGEFVTMTGQLFSDRYGSNLPSATNGKTEKLLRVYVGAQDCGLKENDTFYGLALNDEESNEGTLVCKTKGTSVGFYNASFIIDSPYGRSLPDSELYRVAYNDKLYMFQAYTDISSISPSSGSTEGGVVLTIYGSYYDDKSPYTQPQAYVDDTVCKIQDVVPDEFVTCRVAANPQNGKTSFHGNRGVNFEYWTSTSKDASSIDSILTLTISSAGYNSETLDETYFYDVNDTMDNYVSLMTSYFSPPHSGVYAFYLYADDGARLYIDGSEAVTSELSWESSAVMVLDSNTRYLLQVAHYEGSGDSFVHLKAKYFGTTFTNAWTGKAVQEEQVISITSTVKYDKQQIEFQNFANQTSTNEIQTVEVNTAGEFRFGLYGVYTEPLTTSMSEAVIQDALDAIPVFGNEESVTVTRLQLATPTFQITFVSKRGDFPDLSVVKVVNSSDVKYSVTETAGKPDVDMAALTLEGVVSDPFSVSTLNAATLENAVNSMFEAKCPQDLSPPTAKYYQSFEENSYTFSGYRVKDTEPFCGRYVLKHPYIIYKKHDDDLGILLSTSGVLCFAYKGFLQDYIRIKISYKSSSTLETEAVTEDLRHTFKSDSDTESETWYYTCVDVYSEVLKLYPSDTGHRLDEVSVYSLNNDQPGYIDAVVIGQDVTTDDPDINLRRRRPSRPNKALINEATVSSVSSNVYEVILKPYECGNQFPLFELSNGRVTSGALSYPSSSVSSTLYGGTGALNVRRTSEASPPVTGTLDLTFMGVTKAGLNISLEPNEFDKELESLNGIGALSVVKDGDCAMFDLAVTFLTRSGDQEGILISDSQLDGISPAASIYTRVHGGLFYDPITGDMASTVHSTPQVRLYINDVPTVCTGDCSFQWQSAATPTVTNVSPSTGTSALGTTIVISGTGFSADNTKNTVTIGGVACTVTDSTTTSITCDVGNGPVGAYKVIVNVDQKGDAQHSGGDVTFEYTANITGINPTSGSLGGGITLTISGYGFKDGASVTINSAACGVTSVTADIIECTVPAMTADGTYDVIVSQGSTTLSFSDYTYDSSLTATISTISPSTIGVQGGSLTIDGSSFTSSSGSVSLGQAQVTITKWTDTQIEVDLTDLQAGTHDLLVKTPNGMATDGSGNIPSVSVDLSVTNVYPLRGSVLGGTRLTVSGTGFGTNETLVGVHVGDTACDVISVTSSNIVCEIENAATTHQVTNKGTSQEYGVYYAYDKPYIKINQGDTVTWSWETPDFVNDVAHAIIEVESPSSTQAKTGGFDSGTPSKNGQYSKQFSEMGTFYVWSGYVDAYGIKNYAGTVEVVAPRSRLEEVTVTVSDVEAIYNVGGSADPVDNSKCGYLGSTLSSCTDSIPTGGNSDRFNFVFWTCITPTVRSINANNGTVQTDITIYGNGFSSSDCQNEVKFGDYDCDVTSSSNGMITCRFASSGEPELGVLHALSVRVANRGNALVEAISEEDSGFAIIPNIESVNPETGSLAGGARVTITGFGFGDSPLVYIGNSLCDIIESSYTEIICYSPASSTGDKDVEVQAYVNGSPLTSKCETTTKVCRYSYASLWTPTVSSIDPDSMAGPTRFTITGQSLSTNTAELDVTVGGVTAVVEAASDTSLVASIDNIPAGDNEVTVRVKDYGKASGILSMYGTPDISSIVPSSGSVHGGTEITIQGNGFVENRTAISIDSIACDITTISLAQVTCRTESHAAGTVSVDITSNGESYSSSSYAYSTGSTPTVSSINPTSGLAGDTLTISGSNLDGGTVTVNLDDVDCSIVTASGTEIQCTLGSHSTGSVPVFVHVAELGNSNTDVSFEYQLSLGSIAPTEGGTSGGQTVVLSGAGFDDSASVTICGEICTQIQTTSSEYTCKTPANTAQTCDVVVTVNGLSRTLSSSYTYNAALTPSITGVSPIRGGTGGGTTLTISGSGFGTVVGNVDVTIDGAVCLVSTVDDTEVVCTTGPHMGSIDTKVEVQVSGNGIAGEASSGVSDYSYIDVWSSSYTWGGGSLPQEGEFIIIPAGMTLLLDTDTPVLSFLLIQGGKLIFDEKDVELQSKIIMITDGGLLQVGTESQPFQHKGIITLHGHHRDKELPIYGTKVLAVRNGTLDLHGTYMPITWTRLASTATAGSNILALQDPVEWTIGDEIVIASTGHKHTQSENEKKTILSISVDKQTLTLDSALEATHWGTEETFDGTLVEFRAEVGLLTHNVVVRGNTNAQWEDEIEACDAGFDTGEFATQTCFLGRFGDEIGSSQFGAMILVHAPVYDTHEAQARISYTEVTFAGQAFRLGRYPIHFHLNGDMSTSYVRGCGIHHTFNRAVNIHGTHNTMVEKTVIYNIMGGAFFLEDGIETGNTIQYNLAVFVRESSSLLNDDVTPASFWVTNPNNTIQHNAAAGGSHFGFWYRMHSHPDGPSFTETVCPIRTRLGVFLNNTAHSFGWFGLWVFPDFFPQKDACGGNEVEPAVFNGLFAWNNDKGAEAVNSGALQFINFVLVQNKLAGYEGKKVLEVPLYTDESPMLKDSLVVGKTTTIPDPQQGCTNGGIVFPFGAGFRAINVRFVNFDESTCAAFRWTRITGTCSLFCGGYTYHTEQLTFVNTPNKAIYAWDWEGVILDRDGTATGQSSNWTILPTTGTLPNDCIDAPEYSIGIPASMCPPQYKWHRFAFNNILPESLQGKNFLITNEYGTSSVPYAKKRLSHKPGWMMALAGGSTYSFEFENAAQIKNISFTGQFDDFKTDDYLFLKIAVEEVPDRFSFDGGDSFINATIGGIDPSTAKNGDWEWDNINSEVKFVVHGRKRSRRGMSVYTVDRPLSFTSYKCFYADCIPPPDPDTIPPATERPLDFEYWDDNTRWNNSNNDTFVTNIGGSYGIPQDGDSVTVASGSWVVVNKTTSFNKLGTLLLEGVLEFLDTPGAVYEIEADFIIIRGGRLIIGWPDDPFDGLATITLRGDHSSSYFNPGDGPTLGSKAIGVFGGLDLFGQDKGLTWTQLASTANAGGNTIVLSEGVQWSAGDDIVIGPTSFDPWETESFKIVSVAADNVTLTLNSSLRYRHTAHQETLTNDQEINVGAAVGLLSHNIKIVGQDYTNLYKESFGARVLVGLVTYRGQTYTGYARLSNVEFYHTGQEGFTEEYDPRFSLSYVATGTVSNVKPSSVTKCSFHNGFNTAIGAFGIGSLDVKDNVIFGTVGNSLSTSSNDTRVEHNLVVLMISTATYQDRYETFNPRWEAAIEAMTSTQLTLRDNLVSGSERIAFHIPPQDCDDTSDLYRGNKAYANVIGFVILPEDALSQTDCVKIAGHTAWKNHDFGIYYQNEPSLVAENNLYIENQNGLLPIVLRPDAVSHQYANKTVQVVSSTFVGQTDSFDCTIDITPTDDNYELSGGARPSLPPSRAMVGLIFPNFYQKSNMAPGKPWKGCMAYNAIGGLMTMKNITFAKYKSSSCKSNIAVTTNVANDDGQHPVEAEQTHFIDVDSSNKIFYHRPNVGKINSADCVDMDCDALKKALFKDLDGTFLGHIGAVIPQSEYEWDGDPRHGLGDYRIPKEMVTDSNGDRIPYNTIAPNKGIIRNDKCTYKSSWQAYECYEELNYEMLIIENMDPDTETRRLSPVAVLGDGYIDLINGPQDHGWCSGYTCRKRISTFMALVVTDKEFLIHFTSTTPKHMRYRLLNTNDNEGVKLKVWYSRSNRLDVYVDDDFVLATNARIDGQGRYITSQPKGNEFEPQIANGTGANFFDRDRGEITFIISGQRRIDVKTAESVIVSFGIPALTVDQFFGDNIVENLANFLNIPLTKVRVVNVVSASNSGRRKRSSGGITVEVEIGDEPTTNFNDTAPDSVSYESLIELAADIVNECQVGNISDTLNMTGGCETVSVPSTDPEVPAIVYNTPSPDHLFFLDDPIPRYEGVALTTQPRIRVADISNNVITDLGTAEYPWQMTASIRVGTGHPNAMLNGTTTVNCSNGWFIFTDLAISHMGTGYILDFNISYPIEAENFTMASDPFDVDGRPLEIHVFDKTSGDITQDSRFSVTLDLRDSNTEEIISDIAWRDHTWTAEARMLGSSSYAALAGVFSSSFDIATGHVVFPDLTLTGFGMYYIQFRVVSNPPDFNLTLNHKMTIINSAHIGMVIEEEYELQVKFDVDFIKVLPTVDKQNEFEQMILTEYANIWSDVQLTVGSIREGSIVVTFVIAGSYSSVNTTAYSLCNTIYNGTTYSYNGYSLTLSPYLTVNNQTYYGVTCGDRSEEEDDEMEGYLIAIIVILCLLLVVAVVAIVIWRCSVKPKTRTHVPVHVKPLDSNINGPTFTPQYIGFSDGKVEDYLFREDSFTSMKDWRTGTLYVGDKPAEDFLFREDFGAQLKFNIGKAPLVTSIAGDSKRPESGMSGFSLRVNSPDALDISQLRSQYPSNGVGHPPPSYSASVRANRNQASTGGLDSRSHSVMSDRESPLPPVGENTFSSDYSLAPEVMKEIKTQK